MKIAGTILFALFGLVGIAFVTAAVEYIAESINKKNKHEDEDQKC